jgi:hypothetical protein
MEVTKADNWSTVRFLEFCKIMRRRNALKPFYFWARLNQQLSLLNNISIK